LKWRINAEECSSLDMPPGPVVWFPRLNEYRINRLEAVWDVLNTEGSVTYAEVLSLLQSYLKIESRLTGKISPLKGGKSQRSQRKKKERNETGPAGLILMLEDLESSHMGANHEIFMSIFELGNKTKY